MGLFYVNLQAGPETTNANLKTIESILLAANPDLFMKVQGEKQYIIVLDSSDVDQEVAPLNDLGLSLSITCTPLIPYETFAKNTLKFDEKLLPEKNTPVPIDISKPLFFLNFTFGYQGRTEEEMRDIWSKEALTSLTYKYGGQVPVDLYKVATCRQLLIFLQMDEVSLDMVTSELPMMKLMGDQVTIVTKAVKTVTA